MKKENNITIKLGKDTYNFKFTKVEKLFVFETKSMRDLAKQALTSIDGSPVNREIKTALIKNKAINNLRTKSTNTFDLKVLNERFTCKEFFSPIGDNLMNDIKKLRNTLQEDRLVPLLISDYIYNKLSIPATQLLIKDIMGEMGMRKNVVMNVEKEKWETRDHARVREILKISNLEDWTKKVQDATIEKASNKSENERLAKHVISSFNNKIKKSKSKKILAANPEIKLNPYIKEGPYKTKRTDVYLEFTQDGERKSLNMEIGGCNFKEYIQNLKNKMFESSLEAGIACYFIFTDKKLWEEFKFEKSELEKLSTLENKVLTYNFNNSIKVFNKVEFIDMFYLQLCKMFEDAGLETCVPAAKNIVF